MIIIPLSRKLTWKNPPFITIGLILINILIFTVFQSQDNHKNLKAHEYYIKSGLAQIEVRYYIHYLDNKTEPPDLSGEKIPPERLYSYLSKMNSDDEYMAKLINDEIIKKSDPVYAEWKEKREKYHHLFKTITSYKYGFKPASPDAVTLFSSMFLHGGWGHLIGNMIFLWIMGCILELGCTRPLYFSAYIISGVAATALFGIIYNQSQTPLVGASGAIAGLMGMITVLYGMDKIRIFFSLGFFFNYMKIRAIALLPLWIGQELFRLFFGGLSNTAYVAHIGGLAAGAAIGFILLKIPSAVQKDIFEDNDEDQINTMIEKAMELTAELDMENARKILIQALSLEPDNIEVLKKLFHIDKNRPDEERFHKTASRFLFALIKNKNRSGEAIDTYKEYTRLSKRVRLPSNLLLRLCLIFCRHSLPEMCNSIVNSLIKRNPNLDMIPSVLMKMSLAYKNNGNMKNSEQCRKILFSKYPHSREAQTIKSFID